MHRNFIDLPDLHGLIDREMAAADLPPALKPNLARLLRHVLPTLPLGSRDIPGPADPVWAHRAARADQALFRLDACGRRDARAAIRTLLLDVEVLVDTAGRRDHPMSAACARRLRGIAHWRNLPWTSGDSRQLGRDRFGDPLASSINELAEAALKTPVPPEAVRFLPRVLHHGGIAGRRATSLAEIRAIGDEACNCLALLRGWDEDLLVEGQEIWTLRRADELVAVLRRDPEGTVVELRGPRNADIGAEHLLAVLHWLAAAGFALREVEIDAAALVAALRENAPQLSLAA